MLREYFLYAKKTKITTLFNNSCPPRHPSAILESMRVRCLHRLRFDLNENNVSAWRSWHRTAYAVCVQWIFSKMALGWRGGDTFLNKVVIQGCKLVTPFGEIRRFQLEIGHSSESCRSVKKKLRRGGGVVVIVVSASHLCHVTCSAFFPCWQRNRPALLWLANLNVVSLIQPISLLKPCF